MVMPYRPLGRTDMQVSALCLGTMTFGEQTDESQAHTQLDLALDHGVNFIDTAEMYAVPVSAQNYGLTETFIGRWLAQRRCRNKVILATKVNGPGERFSYVRDGQPRLDRRNIEAAVEASLRRLQTDVIDLYQLHWPERTTNYFGKLGYEHRDDEDAIPLEETLAVLGDLVQAGKLRAVGVSNETPWGVMRFMHLADTLNLPRMASIQNPYSLINRTFEIGLAEVAIREQCGLLAYGVLASGMLTGKYLDGARPSGARLSLWPNYFPRYLSRGSQAATAQYVQLAREHDLDPAVMALRWAMEQRFMTSVILGATTPQQLHINLQAIETPLADSVRQGIEAIHREQPNAYLIP